MRSIDWLLDNAACASQERGLFVGDDGCDPPLREAVRTNVAEPLADELNDWRKAALRLYAAIQNAKSVLATIKPSKETTELAFELIEAASVYRQVEFYRGESIPLGGRLETKP